MKYAHCFCCRGGHCGGCRRSNSTEKPHAFQVILTDHPPLELSAENELEMADWMQLLCQSVSKGVSDHRTHINLFFSGCIFPEVLDLCFSKHSGDHSSIQDLFCIFLGSVTKYNLLSIHAFALKCFQIRHMTMCYCSSTVPGMTKCAF